MSDAPCGTCGQQHLDLDYGRIVVAPAPPAALARQDAGNDGEPGIARRGGGASSSAALVVRRESGSTAASVIG